MKPFHILHALLEGVRATLSQLDARSLIVPLLLAGMVYLVGGHQESLTLYVTATALYAIGATVLARAARAELQREHTRRETVEFDLRQLKTRFGVLLDILASLRRSRT